jgi:hypothetical protein
MGNYDFGAIMEKKQWDIGVRKQKRGAVYSR